MMDKSTKVSAASAALTTTRRGAVSPAASQPLSILRANLWRDLPHSPGVYWWYFPKQYVELLRIAEFCQIDRLNMRRAKDGKFCLYHGMTKSLCQRVKWHATQELTLVALQCGILSTFRFTLLALNRFDYRTAGEDIGRFMDNLDLIWMPTETIAEATLIETAELGEFDFPLNIQNNHRLELMGYLHFLKAMRRNYKQRVLSGEEA
jgi:hypothetical protein